MYRRPYHVLPSGKNLCLYIYTNLSPIQTKESISSVLASVLTKDSATPLLKLEHRHIQPITYTKLVVLMFIGPCIIVITEE